MHADDNLSIAQKIVGLLRQKSSLSPRVNDWRWVLGDIQTIDVTLIAGRLDLEISSAFFNIPFYSWVRFMLGYSSMTISTFLDGVLSSRNDFARYLREFGMQNEKWKLLSRVRL